MIAAGVRTGFGDDWVRVGGDEDDLRRLGLRAHGADVAALRRPANDYGILVADAGQAQPDRAQGARRRLAGRHPRQRRRRRSTWCWTSTSACSASSRAATRASASSTARWSTTSCSSGCAALGVIPTPFYTYVYYHGEKMRPVRRGAARVDVRASRSFLDHGIRVDAGLGLPARPVRADDGDAEHGHAHGHHRQDLGTASEASPSRRRFASARCTAPTPRSRSTRKARSRPASSPTSSCSGATRSMEDPASLVTIPVERTMVGGKWVYES